VVGAQIDEHPVTVVETEDLVHAASSHRGPREVSDVPAKGVPGRAASGYCQARTGERDHRCEHREPASKVSHRHQATVQSESRRASERATLYKQTVSVEVQPGSAPAPGSQTAGLSEAEATRRLAPLGERHKPQTSRSYASIVRANVLTVFNLILAGFGAVTLIFGDVRDALFLGIIIANAAIGITQEVRAKRALDRLSLLVAPLARVQRDGATREVPVDEVVPDDLVLLEPGDQLIADGRVVAASDLRLDESILTGESEPARRSRGEEVRSGAFASRRRSAACAGHHGGGATGRARRDRRERLGAQHHPAGDRRRVSR
jgi:magnesium-transporting ATPase (P-type)